MAISEEKRNLIRKRLAEGSLVDDIAREVQASKSTILRIKKSTPTQRLPTIDVGDDSIIYDMIESYTQKEKKYTQKLEDDTWLYEDIEEGWTFHYDKENHIVKTSSLWWTGIAFPESVPKDWVEKLEQSGLQIAISPLHDRDIRKRDSDRILNPNTGEILEVGERYKAGDKKKAHWHVIIKSEKSISFKEMNHIFQSLTNGTCVQKCRSLKNTYDYFTHDTDAARRDGKYQYNKNEIIRLNNFSVTPNKEEIGVLQCEIVNVTMKHKFTKMTQLLAHYKDQPEMMSILWNKPGIISSLLRSQWREQNPTSPVQLTHELSKEEYETFNIFKNKRKEEK